MNGSRENPDQRKDSRVNLTEPYSLLTEVLVIVSQPLAIGALDCGTRILTWGQPIPCVSDFSRVIVEIPPPPAGGASPSPAERIHESTEDQEVGSDFYRRQVVTELLLAPNLGTHVAWIACKDSDASIVEEILGLKPVMLRRDAPGRSLVVVDPSFQTAAKEIIEYYFLLPLESSPKKTWKPLAKVPQGEVAIAAVRTGDSRVASTWILPPPASGALHILSNAISNPRASLEVPRASRGLWKLAVMLVVLAALVLCARYNQRRHLRHISEQGGWGSRILHWNIMSPQVHYLERFGAESWDELQGNQSIEGLRPDQLLTLLQFFFKTGLHAQETRLLRLLLQDPTPTYSGIVEGYLDGTVLSAVESASEDSRYEDARYFAQHYINFAHELPYWTGFLFSRNEELNYCRKMLDLVESNYLYADPSTARSLLHNFQDWYYSEPSGPIIDSSLTDNIAYRRTYYNIREGLYETGEERAKAWLDFAEDFPRSEKVEEAYFNAISVSLNWDLESVTFLSRDFISSYPRSYLADDAAYYLMRRFIEQRDFAAAAFEFRRLVSDYPESDSAKRSLFLILSYFQNSGVNTFAARGLVDKILEVARMNPESELPPPDSAMDPALIGSASISWDTFLNVLGDSPPEKRTWTTETAVLRALELTMGGLYGNLWTGA